MPEFFSACNRILVRPRLYIQLDTWYYRLSRMKILINNSYSQISDFTSEEYKTLRQLLSYDLDPSAKYFSGNHRNTQSLLTKHGEFPTGLLSLVKSHLRASKSRATLEDARRPPSGPRIDFKPTYGVTPYPEQDEAVGAAELAKRGTIVMPTGTGKSLAIARLVERMGCRTLIVVPNLGLKAQLTDSLRAIFGNTKDIVVENIDSPRLKKLTDFDCLIIDEAHHSSARTYRKLNKGVWSGIYYRFFFTATPFRSREEEQLLMQALSGDVVYRLDYHKAVEKGYIVPIEAYYIDLPKQNVEGYTWKEVYSEIVVNNEFRNNVITDIMIRLTVQNQSTLTLVREIAHGDKLTNEGAFLFANGADGNTHTLLDSFNRRATNTLIGTVGVLGEGVDTKPCEYVIIAGLGKAKTQFMQCVGRGVRKFQGKESCKVILFRDQSHRWTKAHFAAQCKILLDEYGVKPVKLDL